MSSSDSRKDSADDQSDQDKSKDRKPRLPKTPTNSTTDEEQPSASGGSGNDGFLNDLLNKLKIKVPSKGEKILEEASLEGIKKYIDSGKCKKIVVMAGAGISTSAGIPDFRSPKSGLYAMIREKYNLDDPQVMFEVGFFRENPKPFYTLAKELLPETFEPTPSHYFVKMLHEKGLLLRHFTQNIDGLERKAGIPEDKIVEAHGSFYTSHCIKCKAEYSFEWLKEKVTKEILPLCTDCQSIVKPDIVFFGENLPPRFFLCVEKDIKQCDLLIIMGTSLVVHPFASLVDKIKDDCPRLLINREKVFGNDTLLTPQILQKLGLDNFKKLFGKSGFNFNDERNRDVALIGNCDDGVLQVAKEMGWEADFRKILEENNCTFKEGDSAAAAEVNE